MIRDWTDSLRMDGISAEAERLFTRLIMRSDDYGRFHADHRLVKANCFPLSDNIRATDIGPWLDELADRGLVLLYESDGRKILAIANYGQRLKKSRIKFPQLPGMDPTWLPVFDVFREVPGSSGNLPPEENTKRSGREAEAKAEADGQSPPPPPPPLDFKPSKQDSPHRRATMSDVYKLGRGQLPPIPDECCEKFFDRMEADGWINDKGFPLNDWRARFREWATAWAKNAETPNRKAR